MRGAAVAPCPLSHLASPGCRLVSAIASARDGTPSFVKIAET
jgi:hypothetical protein